MWALNVSYLEHILGSPTSMQAITLPPAPTTLYRDRRCVGTVLGRGGLASMELSQTEKQKQTAPSAPWG